MAGNSRRSVAEGTARDSKRKSKKRRFSSRYEYHPKRWEEGRSRVLSALSVAAEGGSICILIKRFLISARIWTGERPGATRDLANKFLVGGTGRRK